MNKTQLIKKTIRFGLHAVSSPSDARNTMRQIATRRRINKERHHEYITWFNEQYPTTEELSKQKELASAFAYRPLISIIVPLYNTPEHFLRDCINSVLEQTYDNWELCLANDASPDPTVRRVAEEYVKKYPNIKVVNLSQNQHIVGASNEALKIATGDYIALLDHDDLLLPNALYENVKVLNNDNSLDLIYSDEDKVDESGVHVEPFFKPDWSPDFLLSCNYITHFSVLRKSIVDKIGGFRYGTEGAQDWDLLLRFTNETKKIHHIPKIIYSWRKSPTSTASASNSKPYAYINQKRVLRDFLVSNGTPASVFENKYMGFWRVRYSIKDNPLVSIVIPTKDSLEYIERCINSIIEATSYTNFEVIIVDTGTTDPKVLEFYNSKRVKSNKITIVNWKAEKFNFSSACNFGAEHATGDYLLFLNNDTEVLSSDWIESMLEHAQREEVGMVGCQLFFPTKNIQHAGVILRESDIAVHPFYNSQAELDIFTNIYISNIRNCLAVTAACCMVARDKFLKVGGFNEDLRVTYNDVDLCLKLVDAGFRNVYTPYAELYHYESVSVGRVESTNRDASELEAASSYMREKWHKYLSRDPYYNDNFAQQGLPYFVKKR